MQTCETEHQACSEVSYDWRDLPKRLIQIHISDETARLVESTEIRRDKTRPPRYLTLSYRWATKREDTKHKRLLLTKETAKRLRDGIAIQPLPKTLRDACDVVRRLV